MPSTYEVFKIIFGLIISGFVLFIIIYFVGVYSQLQEDAQKAVIVKNFLKTAEDVYLSGNSAGFTGFSRHEFFLSFDAAQPEGIVSGTGKSPVFFPLFPSFGEKVFISRGEIDMGWWAFSFAEALPRTRVIFSPVSPDWNLVREITSFLPDSDFFEPKVTFGLCDGSSIQERLCGGEVCERQGFLAYVTGLSTPLSQCTATLPPGGRLVTISPSCTPAAKGVCLTPPDADGVGSLSVQGKFAGFYKDPVDIAAAVIGGEKDLLGSSGATLYEYKNSIFRRQASLAAKMLANRALLIGPKYPPLPASECQPAYQKAITALNSLSSFLEGNEGYYKSYGASTSLVKLLGQAKAAHTELVDKGCDYP